MTMDQKTLKALCASIEKWERNATAQQVKDYNIEPESCALCALFFENVCRNCPVYEATGKSYCKGTPYDDAQRAYMWWNAMTPSSEMPAAVIARKRAREEVAFLQSLLPASAKLKTEE